MKFQKQSESFSLSNFIDDEEKLYRAIFSYSNWWKPEKNRPSSAAFKDNEGGVSVDRDAKRPEYSVINSFKKRFDILRLKAIVNLTTGKCREIGAYPIYKPSNTNIYHSEIHESENEIFMSTKKLEK